MRDLKLDDVKALEEKEYGSKFDLFSEIGAAACRVYGVQNIKKRNNPSSPYSGSTSGREFFRKQRKLLKRSRKVVSLKLKFKFNGCSWFVQEMATTSPSESLKNEETPATKKCKVGPQCLKDSSVLGGRQVSETILV